MTEVQPAYYTQGACHSALGDRQVISAIVCTEGVDGLPEGELRVTADGSGMVVNIAAGGGFVRGDSVSGQGIYHVYNDATVTLGIAAADPTDPRIDRVVARVYDSQFEGAADEWRLQVITGAPAPSPVEPALPNSTIPLARVAVAANTVAIAAANVTDERTQAKLCADLENIPAPIPTILDTLVYTTATMTKTFVKGNYPTMSGVKVRCIGGGGGGGGAGATTSASFSAGGGGGGGAYAESNIAASLLPATAVPIAVGAGGGGGGGSGNGAAGGTSSFGAGATYQVVAPGGGGGGGMAAAATNAQSGGGLGATGSGGQIRQTGNDGSGGLVYQDYYFSQAGDGGQAPAGGGGGRGGTWNTAGQAGGQYGGGGGGAHNRQSQGARGGGAGFAGVVIVEVYG